jgi:hypothetical protein
MNNLQLIIKDYEKDNLGIGNVLKNLISALRIHNDVVIQCVPEYIYGAYDQILADRYIATEHTTKEREKVTTARLLVLRSEEALQEDLPSEEWYMGALNNPRFHHLFSFQKRIDWNYDPLRIHPHVKESILNTIRGIEFCPSIHQEVDRLTSFPSDSTLGVSIRTWKASHEANIRRAYHPDIYLQTMDRVLQEHPEIQTLVFSIDNHDYIGPYITWCKDRGIAYHVLEKRDGVTAIQYALIKALTLSRCPYVIGNRISTFTELIFWFGECKPVMYPLF